MMARARPGIVRRAANRARFSRHVLVRRGFGVAWAGVRRGGALVGAGWNSGITRVWWDDGDLVIWGWGFARGVNYGPEPHIDAWVEHRGEKIYAQTTRRIDVDIRTVVANPEYDYAPTGFEARFDTMALQALGSAAAFWPVKISVSAGPAAGAMRASSGPLLDSGADTYLPMLREQTSTTLVGPAREGPRGTPRVGVRVSPAGVAATRVHARRHAIWIGVPAGITSGELRGANGTTITLRNVPTAGRGWLRASLTSSDVDSGQPDIWSAWAHTSDGTRPIMLVDDVRLPGRDRHLWVRSGQDQSLEVIDAAGLVEVTHIQTGADESGPYMSFSGTVHGAVTSAEFYLQGAHTDIEVDLDTREDGTFTARASGVQSRWGRPAKPVPHGRYMLRGRADGSRLAIFASDAAASALPDYYDGAQMRLRCVADAAGHIYLRVRRPFADDEIGSISQQRLQDEYGRQPLEALEAVFFESFFGRNATGNPLAVDREIARRHPDLPRYWAVGDFSVAVPDGATAVVVGSREWWRIRESARWIVTNEWMGPHYIKKPYQTVLQTWHGSMYKHIGFDRSMGTVHDQVVARERSVWDLFVSQSAATTPIIRRAYDFTDGVIETGYPRNDELLNAVESGRLRIDEIKAQVGIPTDSTVVLYAPTWRERAQGDGIDLLDVRRAAGELGDGFTFLQRGHVRTLQRSPRVASRDAGTVVDVSTHPQINELLLVADVLITDYSSVMFDFSVTGKPMIFYTPDIEEYSDPKVRGVYFDLGSTAPGPVVRSAPEVLDLLRSLDTWPGEYGERYETWRQRFNHLDDGRAASRVVDALFAHEPDGSGAGPRDEYDPPGLGEEIDTAD